MGGDDLPADPRFMVDQLDDFEGSPAVEVDKEKEKSDDANSYNYNSFEKNQASEPVNSVRSFDESQSQPTESNYQASFADETIDKENLANDSHIMLPESTERYRLKRSKFLESLQDFFQSDWVFISPKATDYTSSTSLIYCPWIELQYLFLHFSATVSGFKHTKRSVRTCFTRSIYLTSLKELGINDACMHQLRKRPRKIWRWSYGVEVFTTFIFGIQVRMNKSFPFATSHSDALHFLRESVLEINNSTLKNDIADDDSGTETQSTSGSSGGS